MEHVPTASTAHRSVLRARIAGQMGRVYELNPVLATLTPSLIFLLMDS